MSNRSKIISMEEAVRLVQPGMNLSFSGFANSMCPLGFVRQLIRSGVGDLEMSAVGDLWAVDMIAGAGMLKRLRHTIELMEGYGRTRNFCRLAEAGELPVEDYSHLTLTARMFAGQYGIPYLPTKSMLGSDLLGKRGFDGEQKAVLGEDPFTGEQVVLLKQLQPDVAVVHCARADETGNVQLRGISSNTEQIAKSARCVIATVEEIVTIDEIRRTQELTLVPGFFVDAVVHAPFGAHPTGLYGYYDFDRVHIDEYAEAAKDPGRFRAYLDKYVLGTKNETEYLSRIGIGRLMDLRADPHFGISLKCREG